MQFELKLPAKELVSGIFPLVSAADAMARTHAEPGPSQRAEFFDFLEWLCSAAIAGEIEICDELGWNGTFPEILDRTKARGWHSAKHGDPNATKDELRAVDGLIVCTRLASLNAWAAPRGDEFYIDSPEQADAPVTENDESLANLFDPVKREQLEKMFPDGGKWTKYAERARRNGLNAARTDRGQYNPYLAAVWWLKNQGPRGWDLDHCLRVLANNLPERSRDSKHLMTGEFD